LHLKLKVLIIKLKYKIQSHKIYKSTHLFNFMKKVSEEIKKTEKAVIGTITKPFISQKLTFGQRAADTLARLGGSWTFILTFIAFLFLWMIINIYSLIKTWDPYPFILLNLVLSCLAAIQAPVIMMSQNRTAQRDRQRAEYDYAVNRKSEKQIEEILKILKSKRK